MLIMILAGALTAAAIGFDAGYPWLTARHYRAWDRQVVRGADGVRAGFEPFSRGTGDVALLMIHGFGSCPAVFGRMAPALAEAGYTCRAMRLPGFGEPAAAFARCGREDWQEAIDRECAALRAQGKRVWLVGHSFGGALAAEYLLDHPDRAEGLVLLAPLFGISRVRSPLVPPEALFRLGARVLAPDDLIETVFSVDMQTAEVDIEAQRDRFAPVSVVGAMIATAGEARRRAGALQAPLLVVASPADKVVDYGAAAGFYGEAAGRKSFIRADRAGHVIPLDAGWEGVVEAVDAFIREGAGDQAGAGF